MRRIIPLVKVQESLAPEQGASVCEVLRSATHAAHVRINHHPYLVGLTKPKYPLVQYQALLAMYTALYRAVEQQVESFIACNDIPFEYSSRRKTDWLLEDIAYFSMNLQYLPWQPPELPALPDLTNCGALIGTMYVIEGATLGGQIISRHLKDHLGLDRDSGARFFHGYGDALTTRNKWLEFCHFANSIGTTQDLQASAQGSAVHIFELIENQLDVLYGQLKQ
jgi:heme oxygenase